MTRRYSYTRILRDYPEHMSLDQMRVECHISKRTARYLLQNGLVPCVNTGKKTHTYQIATADVIEYLKQRVKTPERFKLPENSYIKGDAPPIPRAKPIIEPKPPEEYPDILSIQQAAEISGVKPSIVREWVKASLIKAITRSNVYLIPKLALLEYLALPRHTRTLKMAEQSKKPETLYTAMNSGVFTTPPMAEQIAYPPALIL